MIKAWLYKKTTILKLIEQKKLKFKHLLSRTIWCWISLPNHINFVFHSFIIGFKCGPIQLNLKCQSMHRHMSTDFKYSEESSRGNRVNEII